MIVDEAALDQTLQHIAQLDQAVKSIEMDSVAQAQPDLFDMVLMQKSLGATLETMDCLLEILHVCCRTAKYCGVTIKPVSNETMIAELNRFVQEVGFASNLPATALADSVTQYRDNHPESVLFRWVLQKLAEAGLTDFASEQRSAVLAGCTIVNCISRFADDAV